MKKAITAILLGLIVSMYSCARKLTVMSYNVHHCEGMDNKVDEERIARIISVNQPDVVAIQELDSVTKRCPAYQLQVLGEKTGMYYTYAKSIDYGGGKYGIGILSKERPICVKRIPLPGAETTRITYLRVSRLLLCLHPPVSQSSQPYKIFIYHLAAGRVGRQAIFHCR